MVHVLKSSLSAKDHQNILNIEIDVKRILCLPHTELSTLPAYKKAIKSNEKPYEKLFSYHDSTEIEEEKNQRK